MPVESNHTIKIWSLDRLPWNIGILRSVTKHYIRGSPNLIAKPKPKTNKSKPKHPPQLCNVMLNTQMSDTSSAHWL